MIHIALPPKENRLCGECGQPSEACRCFKDTPPNPLPSIAVALDEAEAGHVRLLTEQEWEDFKIIARGFATMWRKANKLPPGERTNQAVRRTAPADMLALLGVLEE